MVKECTLTPWLGVWSLLALLYFLLKCFCFFIFIFFSYSALSYSWKRKLKVLPQMFSLSCPFFLFNIGLQFLLTRSTYVKKKKKKKSNALLYFVSPIFNWIGNHFLMDVSIWKTHKTRLQRISFLYQQLGCLSIDRHACSRSFLLPAFVDKYFLVKT